jgi:hypothetical protein
VGHPYAGRHLCPELFEILAEAYEQAVEGEKLILPRAITEASNLRTTFTKIITRAGHEPWPRLFQNLRASCATDWVEKYPNHVVAKWLGHSPMIAATHYLQARERHFEDVVAGGGSPTGRENGSEKPPTAAEDCVHICVQSKAAAARNESHESQQLGQKRQTMRNTAKRCEPRKTALMGEEGLEPPTPSV